MENNAAWTPYEQWARNHATVFGMCWASDGKMLMSWEDFFFYMGFSPADLRCATESLMESPPKRPADHLGAIQRVIREKKITDRLRTFEDDGRSICTLCRGPGMVSVPHLLDVENGWWHDPHRTCAVSCSCYVGRTANVAKRGPNKTTVKLMTLEEYERANPMWRAQMTRKNEMDQAKAAADGRRDPAWESKTKKIRATMDERNRQRAGISAVAEEVAGEDWEEI